MRVANFFNSLFSWVLATLLVCICVVIFYYYHRGDEELRRYIETAISENCLTHSVAIGSASLIHGEGIRLRDVTVTRNGTSQHEGNREEIAFCEELMLHAKPSIQELMDGDVQFERIRLRGLTLRAIRTIDGTWNLAELIGSLPPGEKPPTIVVEDSNIQIVDHVSQQPMQLTLDDINASFSPSTSGDGKLEVHVSFDSEHFKRATIAATIDRSHTGSWTAKGQIEDLNCNSTLRAVLAMQSTPVSPLLDGLGADAQVQFSLAQGNSEGQPRFHVQAQLSNGKYNAPRFLAYPVTDITIPSISCISDGNRRGWTLQNATASYGTAKIALSASGPSFHPDSDVQADIHANQLDITRELIGILPAKLQELWNKYRPLGIVDVRAITIRQNGKWLTNANAVCRDVSLELQTFKYPLTRCQGTASFQQNIDFKADLSATPDRTWKTNPIHIGVDVQRPGKKSTAEIVIGMEPDSWLPIDARIHNAIPAGVRKLLTAVSYTHLTLPTKRIV